MSAATVAEGSIADEVLMSSPAIANAMLAAALSVSIEEGNKTIAEFTGGHKYGTSNQWTIKNHGLIHVSEFRYHVSWDWLMPVVIAINKMNKMVSINFWTDINMTECKIYNWELGAPYQEAECEEPVKAVWSVVVEFIKWYNENYAVSKGSS